MQKSPNHKTLPVRLKRCLSRLKKDSDGNHYILSIYIFSGTKVLLKGKYYDKRSMKC